MKWKATAACETCIQMMLDTMMNIYLKNLIEADCRASQLRVLRQGPPIYLEVSEEHKSDMEGRIRYDG